MMVLRPSASIVLACATLMATPTYAMDLHEAYQAALLQDATTRAARAAVQASDERINQAKAQRYPNVSLSAGYQRNNLDRTQPNFLGQEVTVNDRYPSKNTTLTLRQPLYRKSIAVTVEQTLAQRDDVEAGLQKETQNLAVRVAEAYTQILFARDQLAFIEAQKTATSTQLDAARKQFAGGSGTRTDIDDAQARLDMSLAAELEDLIVQRHQQAKQRAEETVQQRELHEQRQRKLQAKALASEKIRVIVGVGAPFAPEGALGQAVAQAQRSDIAWAQTAVERERKLALPVAPNRLPEAPLPNEAPMSAPLPCWIRIRPIMASADNIWTTKIKVNITLIRILRTI